MGGFIANLNPVMGIFLVMALGYIVGSISFFGVKLGASAILIVALVFGHFGFKSVGILGSIGLPLFLAPTGLMAGKTFVSNIKQNGISLFVVAIVTCIVGGIAISFSSVAFDIPIELALGLGTGALTSTAMLGTVNSLTDSILPSVGYGIAYVFGVVGVVLFVQLVPKIFKVDRDEENAKLELPEADAGRKKLDPKSLINFDGHGLAGVAITIVLGVAIGSIKIPVGDAMVISIGNGGGAIIAGIILAHFGRVGRINFTFDSGKLGLLRDFGLALFLMNSGINAGAGFVEVLGEYGIKLFFIGALITIVPSAIGFFLSYKVFKLPVFAALGATTGSMTSAPSLGALLEVTKDNKVANFYAATQPVATVFLVFMPQIIWMFFGGFGG